MDSIDSSAKHSVALQGWERLYEYLLGYASALEAQTILKNVAAGMVRNLLGSKPKDKKVAT
jgi:hypothetical protein